MQWRWLSTKYSLIVYVNSLNRLNHFGNISINDFLSARFARLSDISTSKKLSATPLTRHSPSLQRSVHYPRCRDSFCCPHSIQHRHAHIHKYQIIVRPLDSVYRLLSIIRNVDGIPPSPTTYVSDHNSSLQQQVKTMAKNQSTIDWNSNQSGKALRRLISGIPMNIGPKYYNRLSGEKRAPRWPNYDPVTAN